MTKKYRLLKDLPDAKAGTDIYYNDIKEKYFIPFGTKKRYWFSEQEMINNSEWFEEIKEQEWEILKCLAFDGKSTHIYDKKLCLGADKSVKLCKIHSVKRLSDNEVFSINDEVEMWFGWGRIREFKIYAGALKACIYTRDCYPINDINHYKPKPKEEQSFQFKDDMIYKIATIINAENALPENNIFDKSEKIYALFESQFKASKTNSIKDDYDKGAGIAFPESQPKTERTYTEKELREAEEKTFNAARLFDKKDTQFKYKTFQDYKNNQP